MKKTIILGILVLGLVWGTSCNRNDTGIHIITKAKWDTSGTTPKLIQKEVREYRLPDFPEKIIDDGTLTKWTYPLAEFFDDGFHFFVCSSLAGSEIDGWRLSFPFCYGEKTGRPIMVIIAEIVKEGSDGILSFSSTPVCAYYAEDLREMTEPWNLPSGYPYVYPSTTSEEEGLEKIVEALKPELDKITEKLVKFYKENQ